MLFNLSERGELLVELGKLKNCQPFLAGATPELMKSYYFNMNNKCDEEN